MGRAGTSSGWGCGNKGCDFTTTKRRRYEEHKGMCIYPSEFCTVSAPDPQDVPGEELIWIRASEVSALKAQLAAKDEELRLMTVNRDNWKSAARLADEASDDAEEQRQKLEAQLAALTEERDNLATELTEIANGAQAHKLAEAREALRPFARFAEAWEAKPFKGLSDEVYGIHAGTPWEAYLRLSDCVKARAVLSKLGG